jgi:precorrin-3B synthase
VNRTRDHDACPGALHVHQAADGALARVRLPGGMIEPAQLEALAHAATRFGSPAMELTSRGNIQIRGIRSNMAADALGDAVAAAGLLPSPTHERVRNIVASPLSGRVGGHADVRDWVRELDTAIQAAPALAELPGRFWFGIDDGTGDVSGLGADVGVHAFGDSVAVLLAGRDTGVRIAPSAVVPTLLSIALRFVDTRGTVWRVAELADATALVDGLVPSAEPGRSWPPVDCPPVGWIGQDDGRNALGAAMPLGVLQARAAEFLAAIRAPMVITPWRSVLVCDLDDGVADAALRVLAPLGLVFD